MSRQIESLAKRLQFGSVNLCMPNGRQYPLGDGPPYVDWYIHGTHTLRRILRNPDPQIGATYIQGDWDIGPRQLSPFLSIFMRSFPEKIPTGLRRAFMLMTRQLQQWNLRRRSYHKIARHYDFPEWLYRQFLDQDLQYSCAYFLEPDVSLEEAQRAKCRLLSKKLCLEPGQTVLDIGCGWGGLALHLAKHAGVRVTGISLSREQVQTAQRKAVELGLEKVVNFRVQDYREHRGYYDRIVSVGMFEHVGHSHFQTFFNKVKELLSDDGVAVLQTIGRHGPPGRTDPWIRKYIFPGGCCASLSEVSESIERSGLITADVEVLRLHYAMTLAAWQERFYKNRGRVAQRMGREFCRMWEFYLAVTENAFRWQDLVVYQIQLIRQHQSAPLTRHYLYPHQEETPFHIPYPFAGKPRGTPEEKGQ
ncbi:MAG: cyclopropane-fatty-acyl-phospholipid synthase family protein [Gammaproteobacteria bacterium]